MDRTHFLAALALGRLDADSARVATVVDDLGSGALDPGQLFTTLMKSKVARLARVALSGAKLNGPARVLLDRIDEAEDAEDAWRQIALPPMKDVLARAAADGGRVIKGLAVQAEYPEPDSRHVGDVDLQYPGWDQALPTLRWLRAAGWAYDTAEYCWLKWHPQAGLYGQLSLVLPDNVAPYARVDLHLGPYSVGHAGLLPLTGWQPGSPLGVAGTVPAPEVSVAVVAAHAVCDQMLSVKDVNDLHVLSRNEWLDWTSALELARSVQAEQTLLQLAALVRATYPEDRLPLAEPAREVLGYGALDPQKRAQIFADLADRDERARGGTLEAVAGVAESAREYFSADLTPHLTDRAGTGPEPGLRRRDLCWRLLPQETWDALAGDVPDGTVAGTPGDRAELATGLELVRAGSGVAVTFGADVFVPTVWGDVDPASIALARRLTA